MATQRSKQLFRSQLDQQLKPLKRLTPTRPKNGWVRAVRTALGMSGRQLADRIGIKQPAVAALERSEARGAITLRTLERAAEALDCRVVYALVPLEGSLEDIVRRRARAVATQMVERASHSMVLESQGVAARFTKQQIDQLTEDLVREMPRSLWDLAR